jgi:hypothetical protein
MTAESFDFSGSTAIPGLKYYRAMANGTIWSEPRKGAGKHWKKMKPVPYNGYHMVLLRDGGTPKQERMVHILILRAFVGYAPLEKPYACHRNDVGTDNRLENLYWGDAKDQVADMVRNGKINPPRGTRAARCVLDDDDVIELRRRHANGEHINVAAEANRRGVSDQTIYNILRYKRWRHLPPPQAS